MSKIKSISTINAPAALGPYSQAIRAGGFIYIAASDLIPELHKESSLKKSILNFIFLNWSKYTDNF